MAFIAAGRQAGHHAGDGARRRIGYGPAMSTKALRPLLFAALAALAAGAAAAQPAAPPTAQPQEVLQFETIHATALDLDEIGSGWGLVSIYPGSYQVGIEQAPELDHGEVAFIKAGPGGNYAQGDLMQTVITDGLGGKRLRTSARIRNQGDGFAVFWVNAFDGDNRILRSTNKKLELNTGWQPQELILDVPEDVGRLEIGVSLQGHEGAAIWLDRVALEVIGERR